MAFASFAANLVAGDANESADIFVHDRQTAQTSADGRFVAFQANATNLATGDTNRRSDIFVTGGAWVTQAVQNFFASGGVGTGRTAVAPTDFH